MGGFLSHLTPEVNYEILQTKLGPIRGNIYEHKDKKVDGYLGIPFAEPIFRFQKPIAAKSWTDVKNCTIYGPGCPQGGVFLNMKETMGLTFDEENCLTLNVFAPRSNLNDFPNGLPVMVNIFGGGFEVGSSAVKDDYSISGTLPLKDVVVVTFNYRVGVLGFFTTGDDICSGNMALWDQTLALEWVRDNISTFGGDPNNVTIFGCSSGGVCADLLTLSTHSRDLFHKCIAMSGTANCEMACRSKENQSMIFKEFAVANGYKGSSSESMMKWYEEQPVEVLCKISSFNSSRSGFISCAPNLDGYFFEKPLEKLRQEAPKKQFMMGGTEYEGLIMAIPDPMYSKIGNSIRTSAGTLFKEDVVESPENVVKILNDAYMKDIDESETRKRFIEFLGDAVFNVGILDAVKSATFAENDVYLYSFNYFNPDEFGPLSTILDFKAATHGTDFKYLIGDGSFDTFKPSENDLKVMEMMAVMYSNFAKFGNPNTDSNIWKKYDMQHPDRFFKIDYPTCEIKDNYQNGRLQTFNSISRKNITL